MRHRYGHLIVSTALLVVVGGCAAAEPTVGSVPDDVGPPTDDPTVLVDDDVFLPDELVVAVDAAVTWDWQGRAGHDVVGEGFDSGVLTEGTFTHTFTAPGSYGYTCRLHPDMDGVVHVVEEDDR